MDKVDSMQEQMENVSREEIKNYLETKENENTMTQNLGNTANAVLRGKFIAIKSYLRK